MYDYEPDPDVDDSIDKTQTFLRDRFNFNPDMTHSVRLDNLAAEEAYIVSSIDSGHPVLLSMWGDVIGCPEDCEGSVEDKAEIEECLANCYNKGHNVLIDAYRHDRDGNQEVLINFGWGNRWNTNTTWYDATDGFADAGDKIMWDRFFIYKNTVPNSDIATVSHKMLYLPCLTLGEMDLWVTFSLLTEDSLKFSVESYETAQIHSNCATYDMTDLTIHIPDVFVNNIRVWLYLKLRDDGLFDLENFG